MFGIFNSCSDDSRHSPTPTPLSDSTVLCKFPDFSASSPLLSNRPQPPTHSPRRNMQFYPPAGAAVRPGVDYGYPPVAGNPRMNWPPTVHPGAWSPYDFSAYSAAAYPGGTGAEVRSPSAYHVTSPTGHAPPSSADHGGSRRHNIADILGGQSQNLQSEIAKTGGAGYQKSPTSTTANMFSPTTATPEHVRSPTTPTHPHAGIVYHHGGAGELPPNFYIPALPRPLPVGYDPTMGDRLHDGSMGHPPGLIYAPHPTTPLSPDAFSPKSDGEGEKGGAGGKDGKKDSKKGRATFSGTQIAELEKAFQATQYLTTAERTRLAERLSLSESQVKIWFQNRRTKCRRTSWKKGGPGGK